MPTKQRQIFIFGVFFTFLMLITGSTSTIAQDSNAARDRVSDFLTAWDNRDYATMYSYLAPQSQDLYPATLFETRYLTNMQIIAFTGVEFTITDVRLQGATAAVYYDATIESSTFGTIEDTGRIMRLASNNGVWGVAWSTMDIFEGLAGNARLTTAGSTQPRGNIYDHNGELLVGNGQIVGLFAAQENMADVEECIFLLGELMKAPTPQLRQRFLAYSSGVTIFYLGWLDQPTYVLNQDRLRAICAIEGDGYTLTADVRAYTGGSALGHVVGYVGPIQAEQEADYLQRGYSSGDVVGQNGIELIYEEVLAGQPERILQIIDPSGVPIRQFASTEGSPPAPIQLTIDRRLQEITAQAVSDAYNYAERNWASPSVGAAAIVLDVNTGEILAMTSYPLYDPVIFQQASDAAIIDRFDYVSLANSISEPLSNRLLNSRYFPGSVYKIVTATAALNEGLVDGNTIFDCQLEWSGAEWGDTQASRTDWRATDGLEAAGAISPAQAIMSSCNPFFWQMGGRLFSEVGPMSLVSYSQQLGMGRLYRVNEEIGVGDFGVLGEPVSADVLINSAIGQAPVAVPPIQIGLMTSVIANGGTVYNPYVIQQIGGFDGAEVTYTAQPEVLNTMQLNEGVLEEVREGMCGVVSNSDLGTADWVFETAQYTLCGKTGTAEAGYAPNAWFVAYTPANDPQLAVMVMVDQSREGAEVAAPIVRRILDQYYNVFVESFPGWWDSEYNPLEIPVGFVSD